MFLCVGLSACGAGPGNEGISLVFDPCEPIRLQAIDATQAELDGMAAAIDMWNRAASTRLTVNEAAEIVIPIRFEDAAPLSFGQYSPTTGDVYVNHSLTGERSRTITIAHELGHAFGLAHVRRNVRASLMNVGNLEQEITPSDVVALRSLWGACAEPESIVGTL